MHGAHHLVDRGGRVQADLGGILRSAGDLIGAAGHLLRTIADTAYQPREPFGHAIRGFSQGVALRPGLHFHGEVALGDGFLDGCGPLQVGEHIAERLCQLPNFVPAVDFDLLFQIAGVADIARRLDQLPQRFGDHAV